MSGISLGALRPFFKDPCGRPLRGGRIYTYDVNSATPKSTYTDSALTVENTNPVILDFRGEADIFLDGLYRIIVKDRHGVVIYDENSIGQVIDSKSIQMLKKIDDLSDIQSPKTGQTVRVLGYHEPTNLALANPYTGGGFFIYDETKANQRNGVTIYNGWVRQLEGFISPSFAGARANGQVDERFLCELTIFHSYLNQTEWLVDSHDTYLLNSYSNMAELANYSARILPLLSGVKYNIKGTLKLGSYFDDKDFFVFTDINSAEPSTRVHQYDYTLTGGGVIDFSLAGTRKTTYKNRQAIYTQNSSRVIIENLTFKDGDLPNCITTALSGQDFTIRNCRFINLMSSNLANDDHSTIYGTAKGTKIENCHFQMDTINGYLNACAVELHNSDSYFKNSTIKRYRATHIIAAITIENPYIENIEVTGLDCEIYRNFSILDVWTGSTLFGAKVHDNKINVLQFPTVSELTNAGFNPSVVYAGSAMCLTTNDSAVGYSLTQGNCYEVEYYNNNYNNSRNDDVPSKFKSMIYMVKSLSMGVHFYNNTSNCKNIFRIHEDVSQDITKFNIDGLHIAESNIFSDLENQPLRISVNSIQSSSININLKKLVNIDSLIGIEVLNLNDSGYNTVVVDGAYRNNVNIPVTDSSGFLSKSSNRFSFPRTHGIYFSEQPNTEANFYFNNTKTAKIIDRLNIPEGVIISEFIGGASNGKLVATCQNATSVGGTYNARILVSNI